MAELSDVKHIWLDTRSICHIVASEQTGWVHTACGTLATGKSITEWPLKPRICRKCRQRLKVATVVKQEPITAKGGAQ